MSLFYYFVVFGILTIVGGTMGYVKAKSRPSLIAGGASGILLLVAAGLMNSTYFQVGVILGLIISLALAGRFVPAFIRTRAPMPAGLMSILSIIGIVLTLRALL